MPVVYRRVPGAQNSAQSVEEGVGMGRALGWLAVAVLVSGLTGCKSHTAANEGATAERVQTALEQVYREGTVLTKDVGGSSGTREFAEAVIAAMP